MLPPTHNRTGSMIDYTKTARTRLAELFIAITPGMGYVASDISVGVPAPDADHKGYNTRVAVTPSNGPIYVPRRMFHYNRIDLADYMLQFSGNTLIAPGITNTHQAIPAILAQFDLALDVDDIELYNIVGNQCIITAKPQSLGWTGIIAFSLVEGGNAVYRLVLDDNTNSFFALDDGSFFSYDTP